MLGKTLAVLSAIAEIGMAAEPLLEWHFDGAASPGSWLGQFGSTEAGPRAPRYPAFATDNLAMAFAGHEGAIVVKDHERGGFANIRFGAGDTFACEAWVKVRSIGKGQMIYLLGKGRHGKLGAGVGEQNQNYAVRLQGSDGGARLGFLFTSRHPTTKQIEWHRWWSRVELPLTRMDRRPRHRGRLGSRWRHGVTTSSGRRRPCHRHRLQTFPRRILSGLAGQPDDPTRPVRSERDILTLPLRSAPAARHPPDGPAGQGARAGQRKGRARIQ
jgi:hypothetical protein